MKTPLFLLVLALLVPSAWSQRLVENSATGEQFIMVEGWTGHELFTFEEFFGADADVMRQATDIALDNAPEDRFQWDKKDDDLANYIVNGKVVNACAIASENLIDDVKAQGTLPDGWDIRQIGTLGTLTDVLGAGTDVYLDWFNDSYQDRLDPPSFGHTLSVIKSPDGNYYTIDNWKGGITFKKVYPLDLDDPNDPDDTSIFFTTDPEETDVMNAEFRVQKTPWGYIPPDKKPDHPDKSRARSPIPPTSQTTESEVLTSADPNDKLGLRGVGTERYIAPDLLMPYVIRFENMATASAPAQEVLVRDTLDMSTLDLATFSLGDIHFSGRRVEVPPGRSSFFTRIPLDEGRLELLIDANLVLETGVATWRFTTLDPATSELPLDPLDGFLPPNQESPEGEGSVSFSIRAREGLPSGTQIRNEARIIFDLNEPIDTPPWTNTFDFLGPASQVTELAPVQNSRSFDVQWAGQDDGSGVAEYDVYLSVNEGPFTLWQQKTPAVAAAFAGDPDSSYAFFSIAYDATGNVEPMKSEAEVSTRISVSTEGEGDSGLPTEFALDPNYPNPFNLSTTFRYAVPRVERVAIRVYDLLGREVAQLVDEERQPGWHKVSLDAARLTSGVYFCQLTAGSFRETRQLVVVR